jgi:polysaccharide export outer membrane protein
MKSRFRRVANAGLAALVLLVAGACALPRPGPSTSEIMAGSRQAGGGVNIVMVDTLIAQISDANDRLGFGAPFTGTGLTSTDAINPGDVLTITVWENVENGLLASVGQKVTVLEMMQVDERGRIFMPYAGTLIAADKTPDELRMLITRSLEDQTPDPQVEVRREPGDGAAVSVIGQVGAQGVYPIEPSTRRLTAMLAKAGGATIDPEVARITVRRGSHSGRVYLQQLYDDPRQDIALRAADQVIVEEDTRSFTALGAAGKQARVPFPKARLTAEEALAEAGGLAGNTSDPTGIFVFRRERADIASAVLGLPDVNDNERFAYVIDLTQPDGIFLAREFQIRDGDTIYVTEAPFVGWARVLEATSSTLDFGTTIINAADAAAN